jgi:hypothetical protein
MGLSDRPSILAPQAAGRRLPAAACSARPNAAEAAESPSQTRAAGPPRHSAWVRCRGGCWRSSPRTTQPTTPNPSTSSTTPTAYHSGRVIHGHHRTGQGPCHPAVQQPGGVALVWWLRVGPGHGSSSGQRDTVHVRHRPADGFCPEPQQAAPRRLRTATMAVLAAARGDAAGSRGPTRRRRHPKERWPRWALPHRRGSSRRVQRRRGGRRSAWPPRSDRSSHTPIHPTATASGAPAPGTMAIQRPMTPPMISRMAASRGKTRARTLASPNSTQPSAKTPNDMVLPASSRPVGVAATSAGACSAAYGTAKASHHQTPASSIVPRTATRSPPAPAAAGRRPAASAGR